MLTMFKLNFYLLIIIISIGLFGRVSYSDEQDTDDGQDEFDGPEEYCSDRDVIEKLKDIILPDDYDSDVPIKQEIRSIDEYKEIFARLQTYKDNASAKADPLRKVLVNNLKDYLLTMPFETKCFQSLTRITEAIQTREKWATKFVTSQPEVNLLNSMYGDKRFAASMGNYDVCVSIESPTDDDNPKITGKWCPLDLKDGIPKIDDILAEKLVDIIKNFSSTRDLIRGLSKLEKDELIELGKRPIPKDAELYMLGICLPSTCDSIQLSRAITSVIYPLTRSEVKISSKCLYKDMPIILDKHHIYSLSIVSALITMVVISSVLDYYHLMENNKCVNILNDIFSVKRNMKFVFDIDRKDNRLGCLDGIRTYLAFAILLSHNYGLTAMTVDIEESLIIKNIKGLRSVIYNKLYLQHNFILISGLLMYKSIKTKHFNYIRFLLLRYLGCLPITALTICVSMHMKLLADGPFAATVLPGYEFPCLNRWYKPLLMISNLPNFFADKPMNEFRPDTMCIQVSWYLSALFQLTIFAPFLIIPLKVGKRSGIWLNLAAVLLGLCVPLYTRFVMNIPYIQEMIRDMDLLNAMTSSATYLFGPWNYLTTIVIGFLLGYCLERYSEMRLWGPTIDLLVTLVSLSLTVFTLVWKMKISEQDFTDSLFGYELHVYLFVHKITYLLANCWIVFACATKRLEILHHILSWRPFTYFSKLLLEIYMLHFFVSSYRWAKYKEFVTFGDYEIWVTSLVEFVLTYILSIIAVLFVTRPLLNIIISVLFANNNNNKSSDNKQLNDNDESDEKTKC